MAPTAPQAAALALRSATPADLARIVEIYNAAIPGRASTADTEPVSVESRRPWFERHASARAALWVATDGGSVVGWLSILPYHERAAYSITAEIGVYVAPEARRRGVARTLLAHALAQARTLGLRRLVARIFAHNEPSLRLFRAHGFEDWGLMPGVTVLDGIERDVVTLGLRL